MNDSIVNTSLFPIELSGVKTNPAKSAENLGVILTKMSPFANIYQQFVSHNFTICRICSVFAVTLIWIVQNYLQLLLHPFISIIAIHFCMVSLLLDLTRFQHVQKRLARLVTVSSIYSQCFTALFPSVIASKV